MIGGVGEGLDHVEALLRLRDEQEPVRKEEGSAQTKRILTEALAERPRTMPELAALVQAWKPELPPRMAYQRAASALYKLKVAGLVVRVVRAWKLTPQRAKDTSDRS